MNSEAHHSRSSHLVLYFQLATLALIVLAVACGERHSAAAINFDQEIRPEPPPPAQPVVDPVTGLATKTFPVTLESVLSLLRSRIPEEKDAPSSDPRDAFQRGPSATLALVQAAIADLGIPFPEGAKVQYDASNEVMTVTQTPEALDLIGTIFNAEKTGILSLAIRFEIYEVPALLALRLEQSAAAHSNHRPEWEALQTALRQGHARLLEVATLQSRSEQRTKYEQGRTFSVVTGFETPEDDKKKAKLVPILEDHFVGTVIELEPLVAEDDLTIDINLLIEYHTAPPEWASIQVDRSIEGPAETHEVPVFHLKTLITQFVVFSGSDKLLVSWSPTGKPEYEKKSVRHLVFLRADAKRSQPAHQKK